MPYQSKTGLDWALHVVRREPAAHGFGLQVGMEPLSKLLVHMFRYTSPALRDARAR